MFSFTQNCDWINKPLLLSPWVWLPVYGKNLPEEKVELGNNIFGHLGNVFFS